MENMQEALKSEVLVSQTEGVNKENRVINEEGQPSEIKSETRAKSQPPRYTKGEETFNSVSHIVGASMGLIILISLIIVSVKSDNRGLLGCIIFGVSIIMVYTISAVYHGLKPSKAKRVLRIIDHCDIYFLIAGTYTPILLTAIKDISPLVTYVFLGIVWGVAALAATLTAVNMHKYRFFSMACYIILGWGIVAVVPIALKALTIGGFTLLLSGGIMYTVGSILYGIGKKHKYMHGLFHIFCNLGTLLQFLCIIFYCF